MRPARGLHATPLMLVKGVAIIPPTDSVLLDDWAPDDVWLWHCVLCVWVALLCRVSSDFGARTRLLRVHRPVSASIRLYAQAVRVRLLLVMRVMNTWRAAASTVPLAKRCNCGCNATEHCKPRSAVDSQCLKGTQYPNGCRCASAGDRRHRHAPRPRPRGRRARRRAPPGRCARAARDSGSVAFEATAALWTFGRADAAAAHAATAVCRDVQRRDRHFHPAAANRRSQGTTPHALGCCGLWQITACALACLVCCSISDCRTDAEWKRAWRHAWTEACVDGSMRGSMRGSMHGSMRGSMHGFHWQCKKFGARCRAC